MRDRDRAPRVGRKDKGEAGCGEERSEVELRKISQIWNLVSEMEASLAHTHAYDCSCPLHVESPYLHFSATQEEPCVVSGFDMDRVGTVTALAKEPPGTFICRFSMSQPGCLVLSCKTAPELGGGDENNLLHAILRISDLNERRVDTWIRDFAGATHVLDVYRNKRVDKRKVFASAYQSLSEIRAMA